MKKKWPVICILAVLIAAMLFYLWIQQTHTFTLSSDAEQVQPLFGTVKVISEYDTDVVFTDVETGEKYTIEYITKGMPEKIKLTRGRWYTVQGAENLTVSPVNVRIE